jgi:hypothetical protein
LTHFTFTRLSVTEIEKAYNAEMEGQSSRLEHVLDLPRAAAAASAPHAAAVAAVSTKSFQMLLQEFSLLAAFGRLELSRRASRQAATAWAEQL